MSGQSIFSILNAIDLPVVIAEMHGSVVSFNKSAEDFFGSGVKIGISISELFPAIINTDFEIKSHDYTVSSLDYYSTDAQSQGGKKSVDVSVTVFEDNSGSGYYLFTVKDISHYSGLIRSVSRLGAVFENSPSSILITDEHGNIEYLNEHFQDLSGYTLGELAGKNVSEFRTQICRVEGAPGITETLMRGDKWKGELKNISKNGEPYWVIATISPVCNSEGKVTNFISVQEDITYLKRIEEELKQSEEKFRILFETLPEGIVITDLSGTIVQVNRAFTKIDAQWGSEFTVGRNVFEMTDDKLKQLLRRLYIDAGDSGYSGTENYEINYPAKVYAEIQVALMAGERGPIGFVVLVVDNTARMNSELALRESEARNRALVEAVPDIMFRVNNQGVYLDKMLGKKISEVFPESIAVDTVRYISEAIRAREIQIYEYPVNVSGRDEFYESRFIAIEDDEVLVILRNVTERYMAIKQIEEARHEAEFANRAKSEFLANMSHEIRTPLNSITGFIELLMRSKIDESQREYLDIIKQSASNLLGIINDILDLSKIESGKLEIGMVEFDPCREIESVIRLFSIKASEKKIRFYSFIDPRLPASVISDPLRIKQVLSNLLSNAIKFTPEDGVVIAEVGLSRSRDGFCLINFSVSDTGIGIPARKQKQIFDAFIQGDNSITRRFGGTGLGLSISANLVRLLGSEIVVDSEAGSGSKFYFTLEAEVVNDVSIADEISELQIGACVVTNDLRSILSRTLVSYLESCGCVVKISEELNSADCKGSDAVFIAGYPFNDGVLPVDTIAAMEIPVIAMIDSVTAERYPREQRIHFAEIISHPVLPDTIFKVLSRLKGTKTAFDLVNRCRDDGAGYSFSGRVLVGEDNRINQKLMMLLLKDYGLDVDIAGNGLAVFEKFKEVVYDLVLMDINMPASDGLEATAFIRDYEREKGLNAVPVIALTAKVLKGDREIIAKSGMNGYLTKPVEMDKLESVLAKYLPAVKNISQCARGGDDPAVGDFYYDIKKNAAELRIPVNVLLNIGRDFFEDALTTAEGIRDAVSSSSWRDVGSLSHRIKGASANLRFIRLAELCSELEEKSAVPEKNFDYYKTVDNIISEVNLLKRYF